MHYLFASQTAHVGALYSAFLAMNLAAGVPPLLAVLALGYSTNLFGALTHYSSGQAAVYFGGNVSWSSSKAFLVLLSIPKNAFPKCLKSLRKWVALFETIMHYNGQTAVCFGGEG